MVCWRGIGGEKEGLDTVSTKCLVLTDTEYFFKYAFLSIV